MNKNAIPACAGRFRRWNATLPLIDLIYPRRCPVCQDIIKYCPDAPLICPACRQKLPYLTEPRCMRCGKELEREDQEYCMDCTRLPRHYRRGYPLYRYETPIKEGVAAFKYRNRREYADFYGEELDARYGGVFRSLELDGLLPVPVHARKLRSRGYNQAALLAGALSRRIQVPCYDRLLIRTIDTRPQKELDEKERVKNLKRAFFFAPNAIKLRRVLLVDDIYTTGATIEACTQALQAGGVEEVYYTSICIGRGATQ